MEYMKTFVSVSPGEITKITLDNNVTYKIIVESYSNTDGYAPVIITNMKNQTVYQSNGYIEIDGHVFITKWKREYSDYRDNYIYGSDLIVNII